MTTCSSASLASIFHLIALGEWFTALRPAEYWESHAGTVCAEIGDAETRYVVELLDKKNRGLDALGGNPYVRRMPNNVLISGLPGSAALAHHQLASTARRLLFCDTEAETLQQISRLAGTSPVVECVQDDGVGVLRGAALILPDPWAHSTLAFLNPADPLAPSDAGICTLDLACELANKGINTVLAYCFADAARQAALRHERGRAMEKALLLERGAQIFEGVLRADGSGFGLLAMNIPSTVLDRVDKTLRAFEMLCDQPGTLVGSFKYARSNL